MIGCVVWTIVLFFLSVYVFPGWDALFWIVTWFFPPLILWPIAQAMGIL